MFFLRRIDEISGILTLGPPFSLKICIMKDNNFIMKCNLAETVLYEEAVENIFEEAQKGIYLSFIYLFIYISIYLPICPVIYLFPSFFLINLYVFPLAKKFWEIYRYTYKSTKSIMLPEIITHILQTKAIFKVSAHCQEKNKSLFEGFQGHSYTNLG